MMDSASAIAHAGHKRASKLSKYSERIVLMTVFPVIMTLHKTKPPLLEFRRGGFFLLLVYKSN
ncbi:hypothetical protein SK3146_04030 [Paenibacillus konkukensis]|uniref:Uncharacterized protein n=1 Tax=Paenibacillus konkukensis TaxID=2020716 RepID=A0ABY4RS53_9BACL|nr:hypothetical protein [Paenibacillus konkukensis]UQZ84775.1 hypothetical protein SK3146_04030 [Paenibacillus konkukensis]